MYYILYIIIYIIYISYIYISYIYIIYIYISYIYIIYIYIYHIYIYCVYICTYTHPLDERDVIPCLKMDTSIFQWYTKSSSINMAKNQPINSPLPNQQCFA